jgi:hypothetical protein
MCADGLAPLAAAPDEFVKFERAFRAATTGGEG